MDWYIVVKTINGRRYRYRQKTWREGGRVRTRSEYIGPADKIFSEPASATPTQLDPVVVDEVTTIQLQRLMDEGYTAEQIALMLRVDHEIVEAAMVAAKNSPHEGRAE